VLTSVTTELSARSFLIFCSAFAFAADATVFAVVAAVYSFVNLIEVF